MLIRQYTSEDFDKIMDFWWRENTSRGSEDEYRAYYARKDKEHYVLEFEGRVIAALSFTEIQFEGEAGLYLYILASSAYNKRRLGFLCYHFVLQKMVEKLEQGKEVKFIQAVCDEKDKAVFEFITKMGGKIVHYYKTMYISMHDFTAEPIFPPQYQLETFTREDIEEYYWLEREVFTGYFTYHPKNLEDFRTAAQNTGFQPEGTFLLRKDGEIIGFCKTFLHENTATIQLLGVKNGYQNQGLGTNLLLKGLKHAKLAGADKACLAIDGYDQRVFEIYRRVGFEISRSRYILQKYFDKKGILADLQRLNKRGFGKYTTPPAEATAKVGTSSK